jgi:hypothetical protein
MPRHHMINNVEVPFTSEEETARDLEEQEWIDSQINRDAMEEILRLEFTVTPRRIRDATTSVEGETWLADIESKIAIERVKLNG